MSAAEQLISRLYECFNSRDMDGALTTMQPDVIWANGLDGGYVHGREGVRAYWTEQWAAMDSGANPLDISVKVDGFVEVRVHLTARDHQGKTLFDTQAVHVFRLKDGLISRFDIRQ